MSKLHWLLIIPFFVSPSTVLAHNGVPDEPQQRFIYFLIPVAMVIVAIYFSLRDKK